MRQLGGWLNCITVIVNQGHCILRRGVLLTVGRESAGIVTADTITLRSSKMQRAVMIMCSMRLVTRNCVNNLVARRAGISPLVCTGQATGHTEITLQLRRPERTEALRG